ncbi:hypothetical protein M595_4993 [Lyngbya aestuarii BL J]|uniref:HNH endonuclease family protein n=1 Tax=Lyngbya aestuarii BL J TaxID=1348334 RepID=U7QCY8_9CYAN|nr:HNH endonuclease [Lyngbya aestuarii]ERT05062.1 hypothetical protein M595_4993 [Lyngbya aestuarii BL J]
MSNNEQLSKLYQKLHEQNVQDRRDREAWEKVNREVKEVLAEARNVTNFRKSFNRWIRTKEGQTVKKKLFISQQEKCAYCKAPLELQEESGLSVDHSEVHHLAPLALLQRYAEANLDDVKLETLMDFVISPKYLWLVHPKCNKKLGEQIADLPELQFLRDLLS